jgi:hypothetical protein
MTSDRGVDRVIRAWLDQMPDEAPDRTVAAIVAAVEATGQVRRPIVRGRWTLTASRRFPLVAALAVVGALLLGAVLQFGGGGHRATIVPPPIATPTPTPAASATSGPAPAALRGSWLADVPAIPGLGTTGSRTRAFIDGSGRSFWLQVAATGSTTMRSSVDGSVPDEILLVTTDDGGGCTTGDEGRYRWSRSDDGRFLALVGASDTCASREQALARGWVRSFDGTSSGGTGIVDAFDPMLQVTLPDEPFTAEIHPDSAEITGTSSGTMFFALKNPAGLPHPCSAVPGQKFQLGPGADAAVQYLRTLPGFSVATTGLTIDGHRAIHASVTTSPSPACPSGKVVEWTPRNAASDRWWFISAGDPDSIYLVEVGADLYLLQWLGAGQTTATELHVLSSVRFLAALPMAP